jgi:hypothetical protein
LNAYIRQREEIRTSKDCGKNAAKTKHRIHIDLSRMDCGIVGVAGAAVRKIPDGIEVTPSGGGHAHVVIGGTSWKKIKEKDGWENAGGLLVHGNLQFDITESGMFTFFGLMYDPDGNLIDKKALGNGYPSYHRMEFSFKPIATADRFAFAIFMNMQKLPRLLVVKDLYFEMKSYNHYC